MKRREWTAVAALVVLVLASLEVAASPARVRTENVVDVDLSTATFTGNLSYTQAGIPNAVSIVQGSQPFTESTLLSCEQTWAQSSGSTVFGSNGWAFNNNVGGVRALIDGIPAPSATISTYVNSCTGKGYNESASMLLTSAFYVTNTGTGNFAGSLRVGFNSGVNTGDNVCGPFLELTLNGPGAVTRIKTGVGLRGTNTFGPPNILGAPLANQTWYTAYLWSNGSRQTAVVQGPSGTVSASSSIVWHVTSCGGGGNNQMSGTTWINNQTAGSPGPSGLFGFRLLTIGRQGGQFPVSKGYARIASLGLVGRPTSIAATVLVQQIVHSTGSTYTLGIAGGVCPCYLNDSGGANVWTSAALALSPSYASQVLTFDLTNVTASGSSSLAIAMNNTDGLSTQTLTSLTITYTPQQPGSGTPPPEKPPFCQTNPWALECIGNQTPVRVVVSYVCNLWFVIFAAITVAAAAWIRRAARKGPGPRPAAPDKEAPRR